MAGKDIDDQAVFEVARRIDDHDARQVYVQQMCGQDVAMEQRVQTLLRANDENESFLESPPPELGSAPTLDQPITERPGTQLGPYKLLQQIGEGGFGVVYMAEQTQPVRRKVALKIVKPGMDTKEVVARFEAERQALALMDHPSVAKVLDARATESGRPYFVMELVHGVPITEFCDDQKLSNDQRLRLFVEVCRAIQHAHQKGIIHRDVKPSNVMVTMHDDKPVPKVIDFGVAKALSQQLTEKTLFTAYGQMVGTPLYMSPEQAQWSGLDVDTRSDIYSLGVLLYVLLTGATPFDEETIKKAGFDEMRRMICEEEPPRPSARVSTLAAEALSTACSRRRIDTRRLGQSLRGELDWIVMKALEKDRSRRYDTAHDFASDIERYLSDQPVVACPPSVAYRFRKLARRNKTAFATASMVALALVFGLAGTTWQAVRANSQRDQAIEAKQLAHDRLGRTEKAESEARQLQQQAERHSDKVTRLLAASYAGRAQVLCEQGEIGRGLLWFARSLQDTPADSVDLRRVIRTNIAAWQRHLHPLSMVLQHPGETVAVAFHPDGSRVLTGCKDGTLQLWDASTGESIRKSTAAHAAWAHVNWLIQFDGAAFHPDGSKILTASNEITAQLWDAETLEPIGEPIAHSPEPIANSPPDQSLRAYDRVKLVAFSPDGTRFVTADGNATRQWDTATREPVGDAFARGIPRAVRYCPSGLHAAVHTTSTRVQLWNLSQDRPVGPPVFHANLFAVAISPDGSLLATGDGGGRIKLWLAESGEPVLPPLKHPAVVWRLEFSPDGSQLLSGGGTRSSVLWDVTTGAPIGPPLRERSSVRTIAFHPTGTRVLTGGEDGSVRLWDLAPNESVGRAIGHSDPVVAAGYSVDGLRILTESHGGYQLRDALTGQAIGPSFSLDSATLYVLSRKLPDAGTTHLTFSPDGAQVLIRTDCSELRDVATGRAIGAPYAWFAGKGVRNAAFSPDGTRILVGDTHGPGRLWDTWRLAPIGPPLPHQASSVAFSPDGSRFVTGSFDGTTQMWDSETLRAIGEPWIHQSEVKALAWSPDGAFLLVGFADGTARLWEMETLAAVGVPLHHRNVLCSVAFSPDSSRLLTCSLDETAQLWDTATGEPIGPTIRHGLGRPTGCFSPDGAEILITGFDGPPRVWKTPPGPLRAVDAQRITAWAEVVTGLKLDQRGGIDALDGPAWRKHHQRLDELGGPPARAPLPPPSFQTKRSRSVELALEGRHQAEQGRWDQALTTFAMALQDNAGTVTLHHQIAAWSGLLAEEQLNAAQYERCEQLSLYAASLLEDLVDQFPEKRKCRDALAWCYALHEQALRNMGRVAEANEVRRRIVALFPEDLRDRHNLAREWVIWGTYLKQWYQPTREVGQQLAIAAALLRAEIDEAQRQPQLKRFLPQAHQLLGKIHAFAGRVDQAKACYQRVLQIYPDYHHLHLLLSQLLLSQPRLTSDDVQAALRRAQAAMDAIPDNDNVLGTFGIACYRAGDYAAADKALESARSRQTFVDRTNAIRWCYLAMARWQLGQKEQATDAYRQATDTIERYGFNSDTIRRLNAETAELLGVRLGDELDAQHQ